MRIKVLVNIFIILFASSTATAQTIINFDDQGWDTDQSLDSNFTINNFSFSSNQKFYTNYGYNFDVNNISIYFVFQKKNNDKICITTVNNELTSLNSFSFFQASEQSTDSLIIEGWNGINKKYSRAIADYSGWQTLNLNYDGINKVVIRLDSMGASISDFNFDNFSFGFSPLPIELTKFIASTEQNYVKLEWKTATELNNYGFEIERIQISKMGELQDFWSKIGFVRGNGTTTNPNSYSFSDNTVKNGYEYKYRLKQIDINGTYNYSQEIDIAINITPTEYSLSQNYPNPFNPSTTINYSVSKEGKVVLKLYDILGNEIVTLVNEFRDAGSYFVKFSPQNLSSGIYIYEMRVYGSSQSSGQVFVARNKMILVK